MFSQVFLVLSDALSAYLNLFIHVYLFFFFFVLFLRGGEGGGRGYRKSGVLVGSGLQLLFIYLFTCLFIYFLFLRSFCMVWGFGISIKHIFG